MAALVYNYNLILACIMVPKLKHPLPCDVSRIYCYMKLERLSFFLVLNKFGGATVQCLHKSCSEHWTVAGMHKPRWCKLVCCCMTIRLGKLEWFRWMCWQLTPNKVRWSPAQQSSKRLVFTFLLARIVGAGCQQLGMVGAQTLFKMVLLLLLNVVRYNCCCVNKITGRPL